MIYPLEALADVCWPPLGPLWVPWRAFPDPFALDYTDFPSCQSSQGQCLSLDFCHWHKYSCHHPSRAPVVPVSWVRCSHFLTISPLCVPSGSAVENLPAVQDTWMWSMGWEDPLVKEMAAHSSILAWEVPWTEEPGRLQSITGVTRVTRVSHNIASEHTQT